MNKIENKFLKKAVERGGIYFYSKSDAIQFINECRGEGIVILGIDAFVLTSTTTQPSMNNSVDYSMQPFEKEIYNRAIKFLEERDDQLYFEIVCAE
jgi:hypothetical protein